MSRTRRRREDAAREDRIVSEIVVDAYNETERGWSWYYYLEGQIQFPFQARCRSPGAASPLGVGEEVTVLAMAPQGRDVPEIEVLVRIGRRKLPVRLEELVCLNSSSESAQALEDWRYWVERGYEF